MSNITYTTSELTKFMGLKTKEPWKEVYFETVRTAGEVYLLAPLQIQKTL